MYCQKCGSQNIETARFCRKCGANIAYASQPLDAQTAPQAHGAVPLLNPFESQGLQRAVKKISSGILFLCIAGFLVATHNRWALWLLFPAFAMLGKGVSMLIAYRIAGNTFKAQQAAMAVPPLPAPPQHLPQPVPLPALDTAALGPDDSLPRQPASVTEGTTKIITPASAEFGERA